MRRAFGTFNDTVRGLLSPTDIITFGIVVAGFFWVPLAMVTVAALSGSPVWQVIATLTVITTGSVATGLAGNRWPVLVRLAAQPVNTVRSLHTIARLWAASDARTDDR